MTRERSTWLWRGQLPRSSARTASPSGALACRKGHQSLPALANLYLTDFDREVLTRRDGVVRYADDLVVCCADADSAEQARFDVEQSLRPLLLELNNAKSYVSHFDIGFSFLGWVFLKNDGFEESPHTAWTHPMTVARGRADGGLFGHHHPPSPPPTAEKAGAMTSPLYVVDPAAVVRKDGGRIVVTVHSELRASVPLNGISELVLFGPANVSSQALCALLAASVPVVLLRSDGRARGRLEPPGAAHIESRRRQLTQSTQPERRKAAAAAMLGGKLANQRVSLLRMARSGDVSSADRGPPRETGRPGRSAATETRRPTRAARAARHGRRRGRGVLPRPAPDLELVTWLRTTRPRRQRPPQCAHQLLFGLGA